MSEPRAFRDMTPARIAYRRSIVSARATEVLAGNPLFVGVETRYEAPREKVASVCIMDSRGRVRVDEVLHDFGADHTEGISWASAWQFISVAFDKSPAVVVWGRDGVERRAFANDCDMQFLAPPDFSSWINCRDAFLYYLCGPWEGEGLAAALPIVGLVSSTGPRSPLSDCLDMLGLLTALASSVVPSVVLPGSPSRPWTAQETP